MLYFVSVFFVILSSKGSFISFFEVDYFILDLLLIWIGLERKLLKKSDIVFFLKFCLIYSVFVCFRFFFLNNLAFRFLLSDFNFLIKYILLSFLYCAVLKEKALEYIVKVTVIGAIISLPFYVMQLIDGNLLFSIGSLINLPPRFGNPNYTNFVLFTFDQGHAIRNCGFTWEPGANGCFLNMGLLFYLVLNNFNFDRKAKLVTLAIITTLSTTSYIALAIILLIQYRANGGKLNRFVLIATPIVLVAAFQLPFMIDKIVEIYNHDIADLGEIQNLSSYYLKNGGQLPLNRFGSVIYIYDLFGAKLIWGVCNIFQEASSGLDNVNISNGLIDYIAKFGIIGLAFLIYKYALLLKKFLLSNELIVYSVIVMLLLSFGEPMLIFQTTIVFLFLYHYTIGNTSKNSNDDDLTEDDASQEVESHQEPQFKRVILNVSKI